MIAAARLPLRSDPAKSQFLRPSAQGRIWFSHNYYQWSQPRHRGSATAPSSVSSCNPSFCQWPNRCARCRTGQPSRYANAFITGIAFSYRIRRRMSGSRSLISPRSRTAPDVTQGLFSQHVLVGCMQFEELASGMGHTADFSHAEIRRWPCSRRNHR